MRQTELKLSKKDRQTLEEFRSKGNHMAREFNRAHILAALDRKIPESEIMEVLGVGRTAIWRTRAAYSGGRARIRAARHGASGQAQAVPDQRGGRGGSPGLFGSACRGRALDSGATDRGRAEPSPYG